MPPLLDLVLGAREGWRNPLEEAIFGTGDPVAIAEQIGSFLGSTIGTVADAHFYLLGVGVVAGVRLSDGRDAVLKVHRYNVSEARLSAIHSVQSELADQGLPAPRPLVRPSELSHGIAVVEEYKPGGAADGKVESVRRSVARGLHAFVAAAGAIRPLPAVGEREELRDESSIFGQPHDLRFDFDATASGAEWIDDLARDARRRLQAELPLTVCHLDWRVENLGFRGDDICAIYDWDSVWLTPEPVAVGQAAGSFSTDWRIGGQTVPSTDDMRAFVTDYEEARGTAFSALERDVLDAANLFLCAYAARCEHSDHTLFKLDGPRPLGDLLRLRGRDHLK
jgi:hypothetical protein